MAKSAINLNRFDLASLRLFAATVDGGSLTAGAERFGVSLAAASKRIAELEAHVGRPLLERSKRGIAPTAAGQTLYRHAIEVIARVEQLAVAMGDFDRGAQGHLRLWANASAFGGFLPGVLAAYTKKYPDVRIQLEDANSEEAAHAVLAGTAELAVIGENTPTGGLQTFVCDVDELVLLVPNGHPLAAERAVSFAQALDYDFVAFAGTTSLTRQISAIAEAAGRSLRIRVQVRGFDAMCRMVSAGLGVAIMPRAGASPHAKALGLKLLKLTDSWSQRRLLLAMRDRESLSGPARGFAEMVERRMRG
jgi:DNA-binding transcriptional LysR family regulator